MTPQAYSGLDACRLIDLPTHVDARGTLTVAEVGAQLPFVPERVFWISRVPTGGMRGGHAHRKSDEAVVCLSGHATVRLATPTATREFHLRDGSSAVYLPPMIWIDLLDFSADAILLALASCPYSESDYFRDFSTYSAQFG